MSLILNLITVRSDYASGVDPEPSWAERARAVVQDAGYNRGAARDALIELFAEQDCALSVPELEARLADRRPVGRASVYRALDVLGNLDLLVRVDIGDGLLRYERADAAAGADPHGHHHHHHMLCDRCGTLIAFDDEQLEQAIDNLVERFGFDARAHEVTLKGTCQTCH
jgi:Fur family ferric uptake transcriptional regulator